MKARGLIIGAVLTLAGAARAGPAYAELDLKDGQVIHNVTIVAVGSTTVMARWDEGRGTIQISNLPDGIVSVAKPAPKPAAPAPAAKPPEEGAATPEGPRPAAGGAGANFQTPWQTETEYIVDTIASDLTEMAYFAKHGKPRAGAGLAATATAARVPGSPMKTSFVVRADLAEDGQLVRTLTIDGPIWAPETYSELADGLAAKLGIAGAQDDPAEASDLPHDLLAPTAEHLLYADGQVSARLARAFNSPAAHEEAAMLMAVFEMREESGIFYQAKFELCRTTAHLAFAAAMRAGRPESLPGRIARALPGDKDGAAWQRAIRMRATSDYRIFKETDSPTLLERFERMRSFSAISTDRAWEEAHLTQEELPEAEWWRIVGAWGTSVQLGHEIFAGRIPVELREAKIAYESETGSSFSAAGLNSLNAEPARCVTAGADGAAVVRVIGWGTWADLLQRELCAAVTQGFSFLHDSWSVRDEAALFRKQMDDRLWELRLYPLVRRHNSTQQDYYHRAQDDSMALVHRSPQVVPAVTWNNISYAPSHLERYVPPPHPFINEWHLPNPPPGTAYDLEPRFNHPSLTGRPDYVQLLEELHALAPYDSNVAYHLLYAKYSIYPPPEKVEEVYGSLVEYRPSPCAWIATLSVATPGSYEKWMRRAIAMKPSLQNELATFFASRGRNEEAEATYEKWMETETDDVRIANSIEWLVEYKERKGDDSGATALAQRTYKTGSSTGMLTMAHLLEHRKLYDAAYRLYAEVRERYNESRPMIGFLVRMKRIGSAARKDSLLDNLMLELFPKGLVAAPADPGTQAPTSGALVNNPYDESCVTGLKWRDVIVALDGYQVSGSESFDLVRQLDPGAPLDMTIWRGGRYIRMPSCAGSYVVARPSLSAFRP